MACRGLMQGVKGPDPQIDVTASFESSAARY